MIISVKKRFLRSWVNNLIVFKKSGLGLHLTGLEKIGGLVT